MEKNKWAQFDIDVGTVLENTPAGGIDRKLEAFLVIIYNKGCERLRNCERVQSKKAGGSRESKP